MLRTLSFLSASHPAVVSRSVGRDPEYLHLAPDGAVAWVADPAMATAFDSLREAARMALKLPAGERAFGMLLEAELDTYDRARAH